MPVASYRLVYPYDLPSVSNGQHWAVRAKQRKQAIKIFGELIPQLRATTHAYVTFTRIQGPGQRDLDSDNFRTALKGARDSLKHCGYILDDSPRWATFTYVEDRTQRHRGPSIEVHITYSEKGVS